MDSGRFESWEENWQIWAAVAGVVTAGVLWLALASGTKPTPAAGSPPGGVTIGSDPRTIPNFDKLSELERFIGFIQHNTPVVTEVERRDYADRASQPVPSVDMKASFLGGDATDMMSISLVLDETDTRRPVPGPQEWERKTFTFPASRATYMEIDLTPTALSQVPGAQQNMRRWDFDAVCPPLAAVDPAQWTQDERQYVHYLTRRTMGYDGTETGFAALWAAYASNFSLWKGQERSVPAAAYYALAAAHFEEHLAGDGPPSPRAAAITWMICSECHRLLGRLDDARRCAGEAQKLSDGLDAREAAGEKVGVLHEPEKQVLAYYRELQDSGDVHLQRQPFTRVKQPPIGWFIDQMLPAINGDLDVERAEWARLRDPNELCAAINAKIAAKRGQS